MSSRARADLCRKMAGFERYNDALRKSEREGAMRGYTREMRIERDGAVQRAELNLDR
jgi:hypothetical protein